MSINVEIPKKLHKALKKRAIDEEVALKDLIAKVLQEYIDQKA